MAQLNSSKKPSLLICADWFDPGIRAGGPIRSCVNLTRLLGQQYRTTIITSNRDLGASTPYPNVIPNQWTGWKQRAAVNYCSGVLRRMFSFTALLKKRPQSTVYLNSMFSFAGTLWPLFWIWLTRSHAQVVLAPRGMLKPSAFAIKRWKKSSLITLMRLSGICKHVRFHATSEDEVSEIRRMFGNVEILNVPNVPSQPLTKLPHHEKKIGTAKLCLVGRVHPIKNPLWLMKVLKPIAGKVHLVIVGPVEDEAYFQRCQTAAAELPGTMTVEFAGTKAEPEIRNLLIKADAFVLPTEGENFGHAIFEAMSVGTPVIISDQTIWRNLQERNSGWDLDIHSMEPFRQALSNLIGMTSKKHQTLREGALAVAQSFASKGQFAAKYEHLFRQSGPSPGM